MTTHQFDCFSFLGVGRDEPVWLRLAVGDGEAAEADDTDEPKDDSEPPRRALAGRRVCA